MPEFNGELLVVIDGTDYPDARDTAEEIAQEVAEMYASDERVLAVSVEAIGDRRL